MTYCIANGTFYAVPARSNELYHYGVKGMKWGVRRADRQASQALASHHANRAKYHESKIATSKTNLGKNYHNYRAFRNEVKSGNKQVRADLGGKGSILKKYDNFRGHGAYARRQEAASKYYDRKADYAKTNLGASMAKASAYNMKTAAAANARLHDSKNLKEYGVNYVNAIANRSVKTWSGRTTTTGKQFLDNYFTGGMIGAVKDVGHYAKKKSADKKAYKSATDKAFKKYEDSIADIEKNYKRGQNLSKADQDREAAVEKRYNDEVAKAKADYRKARRS